MNTSFLSMLHCPICQGGFVLNNEILKAQDIVKGDLCCDTCNSRYPVIDGIPRFVSDKNYNKSWDFKWTNIDAGKGLAYLSLDKNDPAYEIHGIFDKNSYGGEPFISWKDKFVLDAGCGIGQNSYELLKIGAKVVALDLTRSVDVFKKIMQQRFPDFKDVLLIVQADIFNLPFRDETFDGVMSLGVIHHTGNTFKALQSLTRKLKSSGDINIWIYSAEDMSAYLNKNKDKIKDKSINRRIINHLKRSKYLYYFRDYIFYEAIRFFIKRLPSRVTYYLLFLPASNFWYKFCKIPYLGLIGTGIFQTVPHPNFRYRLINLFDAFSPVFTSHHTEKEVRTWFASLNLEVRGISGWKLGVWGRKNG